MCLNVVTKPRVVSKEKEKVFQTSACSEYQGFVLPEIFSSTIWELSSNSFYSYSLRRNSSLQIAHLMLVYIKNNIKNTAIYIKCNGSKLNCHMQHVTAINSKSTSTSIALFISYSCKTPNRRFFPR